MSVFFSGLTIYFQRDHVDWKSKPIPDIGVFRLANPNYGIYILADEDGISPLFWLGFVPHIPIYRAELTT
jgi:hypothetical protein